MHFTLWPSARSNEGVHAEITWDSFLAFLAAPEVVPDIERLEGWSPVKFAGNRRGLRFVESVSAIVLDDDKSGLPLGQVAAIWGAFAGAIHTSRRHSDAAPRYRIILRCSRDMTPAEHAVVWAYARDAAARAGQVLDESTKDASRLWYVPAHLPGAPYAGCGLAGAPLDVDAILAQAPAAPAQGAGIYTAPEPAPRPDTRRGPVAAMLGAAWPARGSGRHEAQLALAGALRGEGFAEPEAVDFLCSVCRAAGDEDRAKREATCRHTWERQPDAPLTGWTRLKQFVDPVVVDAARGALGRDAGVNEAIGRRLAEAAARAAQGPIVAAPVLPPPAEVVTKGPFTFKVGNLNAELPPLVYQIHGVFCKGDVVMLVAHGNSLKTWLAFSLGLAVATGREWLGKHFAERGRVAILDFESGEYEVTRRLKLLGAKDEEIDGRLLRSSYSGAQLTDPEAWLALAELGLDMLVIDAFKSASGDIDENDARADALLQMAGKFAEATGCTVIVIHHARKGAGGDAREKVRGSTALFAACDRIFEFTEPEKSDDGRVATTMHSVKDGAGRRPADVRVELSDQGLKWLEIPKEEAEPKESNRDTILRVLADAPGGLAQATVYDLLKGTKEVRMDAIAKLIAASIVSRFKTGRDVWLMLNPNRPR